MSPSQAHLNGEPRVEDLLNDPIMAILLRYDGLEQEDVRQAMESAAAALKRRAGLPGPRTAPVAPAPITFRRDRGFVRYASRARVGRGR